MPQARSVKAVVCGKVMRSEVKQREGKTPYVITTLEFESRGGFKSYGEVLSRRELGKPGDEVAVTALVSVNTYQGRDGLTRSSLSMWALDPAQEKREELAVAA